MDLAAVLIAAVHDRAAAIHATSARWPGRPIRLELTWYPRHGKVEITVLTIDHLPASRLELHEPLEHTSAPEPLAAAVG